MECLPSHILVQILANLDSASLVSACRVCQLWSELIKSSQSTMNQFGIKITSNRSRQTITIFDELPGGRHRNLQIVDFCGDFVVLKQLLSVHRMTLASIRIVRPTLWGASVFTEAFGALRNLRQLTLENCQLGECDEMQAAESEPESGCFEKLRELSVVNCNCEIFIVFLRARNLTSLHVEYSQTFNPPANATMKHLTNLLANSPQLENLSLIGVTKFRENPFDNIKFPFRLMQMKVDSLEGRNVCTCSVKSFLENQRKSLKSLIVLKQTKNDEVSKLVNDVFSNK